jgi:3-oxoacyl-[acyl-carrier protein] reductase
MTRKALITGASGALGQGIARRLAADGFEVWIHYLANQSAAATTLEEIEAAGGTGRLVQFDVGEIDSIDRVLVPLLSKEGPLDVLVNNAGVSSDGYMMLLPDDQWDRVLNVNLGGFFRVTRACLKGMVQKRGGRVVNIGSLSGEIGNIGQVAYAASKAGLGGATRALAREMARWNILVNTVAPGPLEAGMAMDIDAAGIKEAIPLGRLGRVDEVAGVVAFLCGGDATYITGQVIQVNGGMGV